MVVRRIWSSFYDFKKFLSPLPNAVHGQREFKWLFPEEGIVKINTDGSCIQEAHKAGYGGLLRDSLGHWLSGFYGFAGDIDVLQAELIGIKIGLWHALELGYRKVVCESDSQEAVGLIQDLDMCVLLRWLWRWMTVLLSKSG